MSDSSMPHDAERNMENVMASDFIHRIASIINAHTPSGAVGTVSCWCNKHFDSYESHCAHVAELIVEYLRSPGGER